MLLKSDIVKRLIGLVVLTWLRRGQLGLVSVPGEVDNIFITERYNARVAKGQSAELLEPDTMISQDAEKSKERELGDLLVRTACSTA